jgi:hypothetical protein
MSMPTWESAKHLLAEYDGAATEIFVIGLPLSQLPAVMAVFGGLPALEVVSFSDEWLECSESFDASWRSRFQSPQSHNCQHSLRSAYGTAQHLQIYLWVDAEAAMLEVEFVFWNDLTFPKSLEIEERDRRLDALISLAEACRTGITGARCVLAPEHNGPTEELLENHDGLVVVW